VEGINMDRHKLLVKHLPEAYAFHRVITDENKTPVDYIFLEVNQAFEEMTGLNREKIIGRRVTEVLPGIKESEFDWISTYGRVAMNGEVVCWEQYSEPLDRHYQITAYGEEKGYFSVLFYDVTARKEVEERTKELDCLHRFSRMLRNRDYSIKDIMEGASNLLPACFQYPESAYACITFQGQQFKRFKTG